MGRRLLVFDPLRAITIDPPARGAAGDWRMWDLSNGSYKLRIDASGLGYSTWHNYALTGWDRAPGGYDQGFFVYLRDADSGEVWTAARRPCGDKDGLYIGSRDKASVELAALCKEITSWLYVRIERNSDYELRRLRLLNRSARVRRIEVTSCIEVVLHEPAAHAGHPAFSKLFVQTENVDGILLARRRARGRDEAHPWLAHAMLDAPPDEFECDRLRFVGRGRSLRNPAALFSLGTLSGSVGNVLDPVLSLRRCLELAPGEEIDTTFVLAVAATREEVLALVGGLLPPATKGDTRVTLASSNRGSKGSIAFEMARRTFTRGPDVQQTPGSPLQHGFSSDGREYFLRPEPNADGTLKLPPMPWVNVIANPSFGFLVSETGAACTWSRNSRENRLTPWSNDPVCDPHTEALYIRDDDSSEAWSPQPGPIPGGGVYTVHHGFGYSRWEHTSHGLEQQVVELVAAEQPVKITRLRVRNVGSSARRLSLFSYRQLVLGGDATDTKAHLNTSFDAAEAVLYARNPQRRKLAEATAFACVVKTAGDMAMHYTAAASSFLGEDGSLAKALDGKVGQGLDACAALQACVNLLPGEEMEVSFLLGEGDDLTHAQSVVRRMREPGAVAQTLEEVRRSWETILTPVQVHTPVPALDVMLNGWLLYQTLSCRMWGRSAFYQSGGAFGFRDQLQDACALLHTRPDLTRAQILLHAAHQFEEGDVLHWWHPPWDRGTRTRFSDDLLWLPFLTSTYIESSGDTAILEEQVGFMTARLLEEGEDESYLQATPSASTADLYDHCCRAIDRSLARGVHGLPLMGTGDWNDGMNRVGREGRGESVWVGFFLYRLLEHFLPYCRQRGDHERAQRYAQHQRELSQALEQAWDGQWYRRAYYDDGTPLGSAQGQECRIDALAQAWAVISGAVDRDRAARAIESVDKHLISRRDGMIRLLTPPFDVEAHDPGYIKGYVRGIRENGGQYTHAALWVVQAFAELGRRNDAARLLEMLGPVFHTSTPERLATYQVEPYVVAADIYGEPPHVGRGGWTWYTGSAAWMYRVGLETILGVTLHGGTVLQIKPCIPDDWPEVTIDYRLRDSATSYCIRVGNPDACSARVRSCLVDGKSQAVEDGAARITLQHDGKRHVVEMEMGA